MNLPGVSSHAAAQAIADFELRRHKQPRGEAKAITLVSHGKHGGAHHDEQLALTIGDTIAITESQSGHNRKYAIVGEVHSLTVGGTRLETTWLILPMMNGRSTYERRIEEFFAAPAGRRSGAV